RSLVGVGRPHVERRRRRLEAQARDDHRQPHHRHRLVLVAVRADLVERELTCLAVDERGAEQQRRRPDRADDQILQAGLERPDQVDVDRREDVERDREPLEPEEQRHQVRGLYEERHPGACGGQQRVVLGDMLVAELLAHREQDGDRAGACDDDLRERAPAVAVHRVVDDRRHVRALDVEDDREDHRGDEAAEPEQRRGLLADAAGYEHGRHEQQAGGADQAQRRRKGEPVDVRLHDHGAYLVHPPGPASVVWMLTSAWSPPKACPDTSAGQADNPIRHATSGTTTASSPTRRSRAESLTAEPTSSCSTAEMMRSMYMAASTIATAPTTAQPQPCWKTPARMRNSPANDVESG